MKSPRHVPQPLITKGQIFQIRAAASFELLKQANADSQRAQRILDAVYSAFLTCALPPGFSTALYDEGPHVYLTGPAGEDIGFPLTRFEAFERAWSYLSLVAPEAVSFEPYRLAKELLDEARARAAQASAAIDQISAKTEIEVFEGVAA